MTFASYLKYLMFSKFDQKTMEKATYATAHECALQSDG